MKLLFIVPNNYQKVGGYKLPINNYKRCFEEKGIEVDLLPISLKSSEFRRIDNIQRLKEEVSKHDLIMPYSLNLCYLCYRYLDVKTIKKKSVAFLVDCKQLHQRSVFQVKKTIKEKINCIARMLLYAYKEKICLGAYRENVFVSPVDADFARNHYKTNNNISFIINGTVPPGRSFSYDLDREGKIVLGCLTDFSHDTLIENLYPLIRNIVPYLNDQAVNYKLIIAGRGAGEEIQAEMKSINNVEYIGFVESLDDFYGNIDAILSTVTKECGVINRILEAWGYGKIAIGFRKNFLPFVDAVEYTNYYCAETPEEFLKVIKELQRSQDSLYRKGEASVKLVKEQYTWEKSANNFVEIFKRLNA